MLRINVCRNSLLRADFRRGPYRACVFNCLINVLSMLPQVYQELLDLVKEEEIKEEKRRSQLYLSDTKGSSVNSLDVSSDGSSADSPSPDSNNAIENRDHLQDLYAVPKRNRAEGPRLPPRRVRSSYNRDPNWVSFRLEVERVSVEYLSCDSSTSRLSPWFQSRSRS